MKCLEQYVGIHKDEIQTSHIFLLNNMYEMLALL